MRRLIRTVSLFAFVAVTAIMGFVSYLYAELPDRFYVSEAKSFVMEQYGNLTVELPRQPELPAGVRTGISREAELRLLGVIPVKSAWIQEADRPYIVPCGTPFGLKMLTDGVVVVGLNPIETVKGTAYPAEKAGLKKGDVIIRVDQAAVHSNRELTREIRKSEGCPISLTIRREGRELEITLQAVQSASDGRYRCGIWVRDSSAGIGTVTFYDPVQSRFGGLGHPVCDVDTGKLMPLSSGEVVPVLITGVKKGQSGEPGELEGNFISGISIGQLQSNRETGVYGQMKQSPVQREAIPVGFRQEIHEGKAWIMTTTSGTSPGTYEIEIEKVRLGENSPTRNLVVHITDPELLELTGGIVQGMSGSPIMQDGRLIGAVTHVFVNDPTRGYGIFIENMLESAK